LAEKQISEMSLNYFNWEISPRNDEGLPEIAFYISDKIHLLLGGSLFTKIRKAGGAF